VAVGECHLPRYRLLETMREDASRRLVAAGLESQARARLPGALAKIGRRCIEADRANTTLRDMLLAERTLLLEQSDEWALQRRYMREGLQTLSDTALARLPAVQR
jgi:hypothetical protein